MSVDIITHLIIYPTAIFSSTSNVVIIMGQTSDQLGLVFFPTIFPFADVVVVVAVVVVVGSGGGSSGGSGSGGGVLRMNGTTKIGC